jgi:hypothetical protein
VEEAITSRKYWTPRANGGRETERRLGQKVANWRPGGWRHLGGGRTGEKNTCRKYLDSGMCQGSSALWVAQCLRTLRTAHSFLQSLDTCMLRRHGGKKQPGALALVALRSPHRSLSPSNPTRSSLPDVFCSHLRLPASSCQSGGPSLSLGLPDVFPENPDPGLNGWTIVVLAPLRSVQGPARLTSNGA